MHRLGRPPISTPCRHGCSLSGLVSPAVLALSQEQMRREDEALEVVRRLHCAVAIDSAQRSPRARLKALPELGSAFRSALMARHERHCLAHSHICGPRCMRYLCTRSVPVGAYLCDRCGVAGSTSAEAWCTRGTATPSSFSCGSQYHPPFRRCHHTVDCTIAIISRVQQLA